MPRTAAERGELLEYAMALDTSADERELAMAALLAGQLAYICGHLPPD